MIKDRLLPAVGIVVVTVGCVFLSRLSCVLFFTLCSLMSVWEMHQVLSHTGAEVWSGFLYAYIAGHAAFCWLGLSEIWLFVWLFAAVLAVMLYSILGAKLENAGPMPTLSVLAYPLIPYAMILWAAAGEARIPVFALSILSAWACDSMALTGGKAFGKKKLAPQVSPNKTWAGALIGAASSLAAGALIYLILRSAYQIPLGVCVLTAFVSSTLGQFGDLAASVIKRTAGVKDYSHLIPEHGGIMDKTDSMLFAIPSAWLCLRLFGLA